jgi:hypothetical protein
MSSIVISGDSSGAITLAAPSVAGTNTATLPAATGTVMVSGNMPTFAAYASGNTTVTASVSTKLQIDTKIFDTNTNYSTSNYRFTPTVAGYYQISGGAQILGTTTGNVFIYKNGVRTYDGSYGGVSAVNPLAVVSGTLYLNGTTDYVELYGVNVSSTNIGGGSTGCYLTGAMVRSA